MQNRTRRYVAAGIAVVAAVAGWLALRMPAEPAGAEQLALGKQLYDANCAQCHGANLEGQPNWRERLPNGRLPAPPHDATGHTWHHPPDVLFGIVKNGLGPYAPPGFQSDMPAYAGKLSDSEIRAVMAYIVSRWPPEIRQRWEEMAAKAGR